MRGEGTSQAVVLALHAPIGRFQSFCGRGESKTRRLQRAFAGRQRRDDWVYARDRFERVVLLIDHAR